MLFNVIQVLVVMGFAPLAKGVLLRLKERIQSRQGPSICMHVGKINAYAAYVLLTLLLFLLINH